MPKAEIISPKPKKEKMLNMNAGTARVKSVNKGLLGVIIGLIALLVIVLGWQLATGSGYYAVYLRTGDIYFGKLTTFPHFGLKNVYFIQANPQDSRTPLSIQRFPGVFWGPEDAMRINRDQVVWMAKLSSEGQLAKVLKTNPNLVPENTSAPASPAPVPEQSPEAQPAPPETPTE